MSRSDDSHHQQKQPRKYDNVGLIIRIHTCVISIGDVHGSPNLMGLQMGATMAVADKHHTTKDGRPNSKSDDQTIF